MIFMNKFYFFCVLFAFFLCSNTVNAQSSAIMSMQTTIRTMQTVQQTTEQQEQERQLQKQSDENDNSSTSTNEVKHDHMTCDSAIKINAYYQNDGIKAEHAWLAKHYPNYEIEDEESIDCEGFTADKLSFYTDNGDLDYVYFNTSKFAGHF
jgi:hypothetical protein